MYRNNLSFGTECPNQRHKSTIQFQIKFLVYKIKKNMPRQFLCLNSEKKMSIKKCVSFTRRFCFCPRLEEATSEKKKFYDKIK